MTNIIHHRSRESTPCSTGQYKLHTTADDQHTTPQQPPGTGQRPCGSQQPTMAFESGTAYPESDADDEYERSVHDSSPVPDDDDRTDDEGSESGGSSGSEHTPTTYGRMSVGEQGVGGGVAEWTAEECADFVGGLGLSVYTGIFLGEFFLRGERVGAEMRERNKG